MIPESLDGWNVQATFVVYRWRVTARRGPITWLLVQTDGGWVVTKLRGGQILSNLIVTNLPHDVLKYIPTRKATTVCPQSAS